MLVLIFSVVLSHEPFYIEHLSNTVHYILLLLCRKGVDDDDVVEGNETFHELCSEQ